MLTRDRALQASLLQAPAPVLSSAAPSLLACSNSEHSGPLLPVHLPTRSTLVSCAARPELWVRTPGTLNWGPGLCAVPVALLSQALLRAPRTASAHPFMRWLPHV